MKRVVSLLAVATIFFPILQLQAYASQENFDLKGKKILFVLTSAETLGKSKVKSGYWLETLAVPYEILSQSGAEITLATPKGGQPLVDLLSLKKRFTSKFTKEFQKDSTAQMALAHTLPLSRLKVQDYDALYYPAGYGVLADLVEDPHSIALIEGFSRARKPIAFLCHAPAVLKNVKTAEGKEIVRGLNVTAVRNSEEAGAAMLRTYSWLIPAGTETMGNALTYKEERLPEKEFLQKTGLQDKIPFLVEDMLKSEGANYQAKANMSSFTVTDVTGDQGFLITGQNPYSSQEIAEKLAEILQQTNIAQ